MQNKIDFQIKQHLGAVFLDFFFNIIYILYGGEKCYTDTNRDYGNDRYN